MRIALWLVMAGAPACNWVFGLGKTELQPTADASVRPDGDPRSDLDRDHVPDVNDPCIAPETDSLVDTDQDGVPNGSDGCPFDVGTSGDLDGDGIPDACDPNPSLAGDRVRCVMAFSDPDLDFAMWKPRDMPTYPWTTWQPRELYGTDGSIVADWPFEGTATTQYDIRARLVFALGQRPGTLSILPRADRAPSASDVGCVLQIDNPDKGGAWTLDTQPPSSQLLLGAVSGITVSVRAVVTVEPSATGANLGCTVTVSGGGSAHVATHVTLPPTNLAFATSEQTQIDGISIYERDDAPPP